MSFNRLPVELIEPIVSRIRHERDISALSRVNRGLRRIIMPLLYEHNARYHGGSALIFGIASDNFVVVENAMELGGQQLDIVFPACDRRLRSTRMLDHRPHSDNASTRAQRIGSLYFALGDPVYSPLGFVVLYDRPEMVRLLLRCGHNIIESDLMMACHLGRVDVLRTIFECGDVDMSKLERCGRELVYYAVDGLQVEVVRLLSQHGAGQLQDLPERPLPDHIEDFLTTLLRAAQPQFEAIILLLSNHGVDISQWTSWVYRQVSFERMPFDWMTILAGKTEKLQFLLRHNLASSPEDELIRKMAADEPFLPHHCARGGHASMLRYLLEHHADKMAVSPLERDQNDQTALEAALGGQYQMKVPETVRALLEPCSTAHGKDMIHALLEKRTEDERNLTALLFHIYRMSHDPHHGPCNETTRVLLAAGADLSVVDDEGRGPVRQVLDQPCGGCAEIVIARVGHRVVALMLEGLKKEFGVDTWQEAHLPLYFSDQSKYHSHPSLDPVTQLKRDWYLFPRHDKPTETRDTE